MKKPRTLTAKLHPLHPSTLAALVGSYRLNIAQDGTKGGTVEMTDRSAVYQARNACSELVELVATIRNCRGVESLRERYTESTEKLKQVAGIAVTIDDQAFPDQLSFAMQCARNPETSRRHATFRAWQHLTSGARITDHLTGKETHLTNPKKEELHRLAELFYGAEIPTRTLDDDLTEMQLDGFQKRLRGKPRKAG
jgi:hypothetical protein